MTETQPQQQWLTRRQAAVHAGVSLPTIDNWLARERLTRYRVGANGVRISRQQLDGLLTPQPVSSAPVQ